MTNKDYVIETMRRFGLRAAQELQNKSSTMSGTELYAEEGYIPDFSAAVAAKNMLQRSPGFLCRSTAGRVVKLLQVYDSDTYPQEPEELPAQWGFYWSSDPLKALPFIALSTSPYATGDCCTYNGHIWRSGQDGNVWEPGSVGVSWTDLGTIEDVMNGTAMEPDKPSADEPAAEPEVPDEPAETVDDFKQPDGAHNAYNTGDRARYNGIVYESLIDNNVWSPEAYPQGWKVVS